MAKKKTQPAKPAKRSDTAKEPQKPAMPRTGFDEEGAKGNGSKLMLGAPGPLRPANPGPGIH